MRLQWSAAVLIVEEAELMTAVTLVDAVTTAGLGALGSTTCRQNGILIKNIFKMLMNVFF